MVQTLDGVIETPEQQHEQQPGQQYPIAPVTDHQPIAGVSSEKRKTILGEEGGLEQGTSSGHYINKKLKDNGTDLKTLTYSGRSPIVTLYFKTAYALKLKDPHKELEKVREHVEEEIAETKSLVDSVRENVRTIDNELDGKDEDGEITNEYAAMLLRGDAKALVNEFTTAIEEEQLKKAMEEQESEKQKQVFYNCTNEEEKEQAAQVYKACEENIQRRDAKIADLNKKLAAASYSYNIYFDNVEGVNVILWLKKGN